MSEMTMETLFPGGLRTLTELAEGTRLCMDDTDNTLYVVKQFAPELEGPLALLCGLKEPHLARVFCVKDRGPFVEAVCEYAAGESLAVRMKDGRTLSEKEARSICVDLCDGLTALHSRGLVHRDIKPDNIIIQPGGMARIIDYGIVRSFASKKSADTVVMGTPGYAAPEQFGFTQSDARTDLYALGVLLNEMLTGVLPNERLASGELGKIVSICTSIDAKQRFSSAAELKKALLGEPNEKAPASLWERLGRLPGLRSKNPFAVVLSIVGYLAWALVTAVFFSDGAQLCGGYLNTLIVWILMFLVPYILISGLFGIWERFFLTKRMGKIGRLVISIFISLVSIFFGMFLAAVPLPIP